MGAGRREQWNQTPPSDGLEACCVVRQAATTKFHMLSSLKPQKLIFFHVLEAEVHKQVVAITVLSVGKSRGSSPCLSQLLVANDFLRLMAL